MDYEELAQLFLKALRFSPVQRIQSVSMASATHPSVAFESSTYQNKRTIPSSAVSKWTYTIICYIYSYRNHIVYKSDVWLTVHRNSVWIRKINQMSLFVFFISLLIVAQHVSGNHVPIIRSWRLRDVIALRWYVPWLQEGGQDRLAGSASMDGFVAQRSTAHTSTRLQHHAVVSFWWWARGCPKHVGQLLEEK